jgi:hypothetical protein
VSYKKQELFIIHEYLGSPPVIDRVHVAHLFSFLCCVVLLCFVCLVFSVPNVANVSGLSILDCTFGFSGAFI